MTKTFCSFWDDTETTMKKPGYKICFVPLYCSLTNYECKHSTDCDILLMAEIAHWVAEEEVLFSCKFLLLRDLYDRYYWKVIGDIGAYFDRHLQLSLKSVYFPTAWCLCKCARLVSHCEIDVELSPPFVYPANRPCVWILPCGTDKGAVYCKKLLKTLLMSVRCRTWSITN